MSVEPSARERRGELITSFVLLLFLASALFFIVIVILGIANGFPVKL